MSELGYKLKLGSVNPSKLRFPEATSWTGSWRMGFSGRVASQFSNLKGYLLAQIPNCSPAMDFFPRFILKSGFNS